MSPQVEMTGEGGRGGGGGVVGILEVVLGCRSHEHGLVERVGGVVVGGAPIRVWRCFQMKERVVLAQCVRGLPTLL